jgi:hypothetical protein
MNYDELYDRVANGAYEHKEGYATRKQDSEQHEKYVVEGDMLHQAFKQDCKAYVEGEVGKPISDKAFGAIFDLAWSNGHAFGYHEIVGELVDLIEVVKAIGKL